MKINEIFGGKVAKAVKNMAKDAIKRINDDPEDHNPLMVVKDGDKLSLRNKAFAALDAARKTAPVNTRKPVYPKGHKRNEKAEDDAEE